MLLVYYCVVTNYNLWRALQAHNNNCYRFCECVLCMCMLWEEVEHAMGHEPGANHFVVIKICQDNKAHEQATFSFLFNIYM